MVWTQGKITVSVHVCVAGPVADVVQTWTSAGDCCLHIYLHDCVCVCLHVCVCVRARAYVRVRADWNGDSPKSTSEGCLTETICLPDGNMSLAPSRCFSPLPDHMCRLRLECMLCVCVLAVVESTQKQLRQQT